MADQNTRICPKCGMAVVDNYIFCKNCGVKLQGEITGAGTPIMCYCIRCGGVNTGNARFCRHCGAQLVQSAVPGQYSPSVYKQIPNAGALNTTNVVNTNTSGSNVKIKRYVFLRIILVIVCAVLLFLIWRDGIPEIKNVMLGPSVFTEPVSNGEDKDELQLRYDEIYTSPQTVPESVPTHDIYEWLYDDSEEGG